MTHRIKRIIGVAEDNLTLIHKECKVELAHDPDARSLVHQLHKAMIEAHYAAVEWQKHGTQLRGRAAAAERKANPDRDNTGSDGRSIRRD